MLIWEPLVRLWRAEPSSLLCTYLAAAGAAWTSDDLDCFLPSNAVS